VLLMLTICKIRARIDRAWKNVPVKDKVKAWDEEDVKKIFLEFLETFTPTWQLFCSNFVYERIRQIVVRCRTNRITIFRTSTTIRSPNKCSISKIYLIESICTIGMNYKGGGETSCLYNTNNWNIHYFVTQTNKCAINVYIFYKIH
jgi:hypothetical protein